MLLAPANVETTFRFATRSSSCEGSSNASVTTTTVPLLTGGGRAFSQEAKVSAHYHKCPFSPFFLSLFVPPP
jgi:hypothetical protein